MDIALWLHSLGMERYASAFRENAIDADVLRHLTADDLKDLGVLSVGHRRKLLDALAELRAHENGSCTKPGERRQVTVLFADLCGFTEMSRSVDAEEVVAVLDRYFEQVDRIVEQHGGHVDKHIGDSSMAVFGAPVSHGNDVERAVRAALAIADAMPALDREPASPLAVHIGIAGGEVVASGMGSAYTVTGQSVNLAARLTGAAGRGEILISEGVRRAMGEHFDCVPREALSVKGFVEPVAAWCLAGLRHAGHSVRPFVGRSDELRQFRDMLAACRASGQGQSVILSGEAGLGKTRLLEEWKREAAETGFAVHGGLVLDFGAAMGRGALQSIVRGLLALDEASDAQASTSGVTEGEDAPFIKDLLDVPMTLEQRTVYEAMDSAMRLRGRASALHRLVRRAARERPRLIFVEDVHWSDASTRRDLAGLSEAVCSCPVMLAMTMRPAHELSWPEAFSARVLQMDLAPLSADEAERMARSFPAASKDVAERCMARAAGNPLFLEQLLGNAQDDDTTGVPGTVRSLVQARLDRLDPADRTALQAASVLGQLVERDVLDHLVDGASAALEPLAACLLLRREGTGYLFHHALIRDAVYDGLLKSRRREWHRRAAAWYGEHDLILRAEHLDRAADSEAPRAYCDAARAQAAAYRYELALRLVERGLQQAHAPADRVALACLRGSVLHDAGDMTSALSSFEAALADATTDAERCQALIGRATVKRVIDDLEGAWADLDAAALVADAQGLLPQAARIHFLRGNLCFPRGDSDGCVREHGQSLALARAAADPEQEAAALGGLGDGEYLRGRLISAHDAFSRCVELCERHGFGRIEVANRPMRAITAWFTGDARGGLDAALASVVAAEKVGHLRALAVAHHAAWHCLHDLAEWARAWEHVDPALHCARELKSKRFEGEALALRAELQRVAGNRNEALENIEAALAFSRETGMAYLGASYLGTLARTTADTGILDQALAEGEAVLAAGAVSHNHFLFRRDAIDACIDHRRWDAALHHADALEAYACREPSRFSAFFVARARALAAVGKGARGQAVLNELERLDVEAKELGFLHAQRDIAGARVEVEQGR
ncbi:adenylate/guanylate cyclase domain-containing protein [Caballeronia sp. LZ035]|uniref:adenylate/guanylate cyclase domain-containing protein n=1 Tax=Caballeronia sp. LZ035 TaxID=3038568 RepID=UPI00286690A3|nr:adenylate/guanylate cyclase domain-containing protein [Caballeronia sp. LZ035]MDR5759625.1 adenylate/guanylate cyclase domain-containing protein [Caballeronia sp. LZ035]